MKNLLKLCVVGVFALFAVGLLITNGTSKFGSTVLAQTTDAEAAPTPTPETPAATTPAETPAETPTPATVSDKTIPKEFKLGLDSFSEYGEVAFNHDTHAFQKYSPDGQRVVGCIECHHTDQPKADLKPPLVTSERDVVLTLTSWQQSPQKVSLCRSCHFQDGNEPEGMEMPIATYVEGDKEVVKEMNNELSYHINCNTCHDAAFAARPELKKKAGFATTKDCMICHLEN